MEEQSCLSLSSGEKTKAPDMQSPSLLFFRRLEGLFLFFVFAKLMLYVQTVNLGNQGVDVIHLLTLP